METKQMKKKEINDLIGYEFLIEIFFFPRIGSGRLPFDFALFSGNKKLNGKEFGKFCRLLKDGHLHEAIAFVEDKDLFCKLNAERRKKAAAKGGLACATNPKNHISNKSYTHWNKNTKGVVVAWNKGLTQATDQRCINISLSKKGDRNPMYGRPVSDITRAKLSEKAKSNILSGKWTPNTFNSRTRKKLLYNGILFRSSWEALFYHAFPNAQYEKIRIPYLTDKQHVYITDFVIGNKIFEIKPNKHILLKKDKLDIVSKWCESNGFDFIILDEFKLTDLIPKEIVKFHEFDKHTEKLIRGLYASVEKRRN